MRKYFTGRYRKFWVAVLLAVVDILAVVFGPDDWRIVAIVNILGAFGIGATPNDK